MRLVHGSRMDSIYWIAARDGLHVLIEAIYFVVTLGTARLVLVPSLCSASFTEDG